MSGDPQTADMRRVRERYRELIDVCNAAGRADLTRDCLEVAIRHGLWGDPAQRPLDYHPGLVPQPVYEAGLFPVCRYLEEHCPIIQSELTTCLEQAVVAFHPVEEPLVSTGGWDELVFYEGGIRHHSAARLFPATAALVDALPEDVKSCGVIMLSRLQPGTHIMAHCGLTNRRLRVHLGLKIPDDAILRIGPHFLQWEEGKCLVFDDSFEHEIWQFGASARLVLLVDMPHPQVHESGGPRPHTELQQRAARVLKQQGLRCVSADAASGRLALEPDEQQAKLMRRMLVELAACRVMLSEHGELLIETDLLANP